MEVGTDSTENISTKGYNTNVSTKPITFISTYEQQKDPIISKQLGLMIPSNVLLTFCFFSTLSYSLFCVEQRRGGLKIFVRSRPARFKPAPHPHQFEKFCQLPPSKPFLSESVPHFFCPKPAPARKLLKTMCPKTIKKSNIVTPCPYSKMKNNKHTAHAVGVEA